MTCPTCGASVSADDRFCAACGTSLRTTCSNCGTELPRDAQFCPSCGQPVEVTVAAPSEERKVISVLFADLAGFTAASDQADPEDVRARLRSYHARVRKEIERYDGRVEKLIGDGVFAAFGAPTAHEDDPERAVRAALRIQESVHDLNAQNPALELAVRIAVTSGEAVVTLSESSEDEGIVGDVVNTASRLQQVAPTGGVVVDEPTYRATRMVIDYEALKPVSVKGKTEPIEIWLGTGARSRFGIDLEPEQQTPFVGRDAELNLLKETFARALRDSSIQLVTVTGEPGVGKTRLVTEFREYLDSLPDLVWWRQGRCLPYGEGITFWALGEIVKAQAGIFESSSAEEATSKLNAAVDTLIEEPSEQDWLKLRLAPLTGAKATSADVADRPELFSAWTSARSSWCSRIFIGPTLP